MEGFPRPDFNQNHISFGAYAMVYTGGMNNTKAGDIPDISLKPLSETGGYTFMSLLSGKKIRTIKWIQNPSPYEVIARVENLAESESMPLLDKR